MHLLTVIVDGWYLEYRMMMARMYNLVGDILSLSISQVISPSLSIINPSGTRWERRVFWGAGWEWLYLCQRG